VPTPEVCDDGKDNDCDGKVDCDDPDCAQAANCQPACVPTPEVCNDGKDNDCDGKVDCDDPDCAQAANCQVCVPDQTSEICGDGKDNDCNGLTDCDDPQCQGTAACVCTGESCEPGAERYCDGPTVCAWGVQTCSADHSWGACIENNQHPDECSALSYSYSCCVNSGACCQSPDGLSDGNCPGLVKTCHDAN
jgi:hypothetical protein